MEEGGRRSRTGDEAGYRRSEIKYGLEKEEKLFKRPKRETMAPRRASDWSPAAIPISNFQGCDADSRPKDPGLDSAAQ